MKLLYRKIIKENPELKGRTQKELYEVLRRISGDKKSLMAKNAALYLNLSFKRKETVCLAEARNKCAVRLIELLGVGRKIIVFGERISQAEELYKTLQQYFPGKIGRYHSKMGEQANKNTIERFRVGEIRVLIACKSMDEGINISDISVGIVLSGTAGQRQRMQRLGRIVRRADGKDYASLYYLHAAETSEEQCFLPSITENSVHELKYDLDNDDFFHEAYDKLAEKVYEKMCQKDASTEMKQEIIRCLCKGSICSDWKKGITEIQRHIEEAESIRDRNYWICMLKLNET